MPCAWIATDAGVAWPRISITPAGVATWVAHGTRPPVAPGSLQASSTEVGVTRSDTAGRAPGC